MKRLFMAVIAVLTLTTANANVNRGVDFNFTTYQPQLGKYLALDYDQMEKVSDIQEFFAESLRKAGYSKKEEIREKKVKNAVYSNLKLMKGVLDEKQYQKYLRILNLDLRRRGLTVYLF